jgi:hypothetical protein
VIRDVQCSLDHPLGDAIHVLVRREDAERFLAEVRKDDQERLAAFGVWLASAMSVAAGPCRDCDPDWSEQLRE